MSAIVLLPFGLPLVSLVLLSAACTKKPADPVKFQIDSTTYAFPLAFLTGARVLAGDTIISLSVHYPDLSPEGTYSGRCRRMAPYPERACSFFLVFLEKPSGPPTTPPPQSAKLVESNGIYKRFEWAQTDYYVWTWNGGVHGGYCQQPQSVGGYADCDVEGKTPAGGTYRIQFLADWASDMPNIDRKVSELVDSFVVQGQRDAAQRP